MTDSIVNILDLPDEILLTIFKKLNNLDVLYSLVGVHQKLENVVCDVNFTRIVDLTTISSKRADNSRTNTILDRFCMHILPRIQSNIECLTVQACFLQRVLYAGNYVNLRKVTLADLELNMACYIFSKKSPFIYTFKHQITDLVITIINKILNKPMTNLLTHVYHNIFTLFANLKYLDLDVDGIYFIPPLFLNDLSSPICFSSSIVHLRIKLDNFDDCRYLLDGRLSQLQIFVVNLACIHDPLLLRRNPAKVRCDSLKIINNPSALLKLKCFSLYVYLTTTEFYSQVVRVLRQMSNLEELTLSLRVQHKASFIDGRHLNKYILSRMPYLRTFNFDIVNESIMINDQFKLSPDDMRRIFIQAGYNVDCHIDYHSRGIRRCHIYSLPFNTKHMCHITHSSSDGTNRTGPAGRHWIFTSSS